MRYYAGIGSRETPADVLEVMELVAMQLCVEGYVLRSGGAPGADSAFERGALAARPEYGAANTPIQVWLPWAGFEGRPEGNGWDYRVSGSNPDDERIAMQFHPAWDRLSQGARKLHTRNVAQILGSWITSYGSVDDADPEIVRYREPQSSFVLCWTRDGKGGGGTGQALRIARHFQVPIFDLALPGIQKRVEGWVAG